MHTLLRHIFKILEVILISGHFKMRELCFAELKLDIAPLGYLGGSLDGVCIVRKEREHFLLAL